MFYEIKDVLETTRMITQNNLDVRTITMGISLRDCADPDVKVCAQKIYDKITTKAKDLVKVGEQLEAELGVPIILVGRGEEVGADARKSASHFPGGGSLQNGQLCAPGQSPG